MKSNLFLCAFASDDLNLSVKRFMSQAQKFNAYKEIKIFRQSDLSREINNRIKNIIKMKGRYLFGFEIWKQFIINEYISSIPENSILHYCDIGCHINLKGLKRFEEYILLVEKYDALVFDYSDPPEKFKNLNYKFQLYKEYEYTKGDVFRYFNIDNKSNIYNSPQIWAGSFFLKKCKLSMDILKTWGEACKKIELLDNSESLTKNHSDFKGMRGSQGIFSIICKLKNVKKVTASECEWAEGTDESGRKWDHLKYYPIWAKRDLKYGIFKRFINRQRKNIKRKINYFKSLKKS